MAVAPPDRLFVYGSLQPGGPNEHVLEAIGGEWAPAAVKGRLVSHGWGADLGYPALELDEDGTDVQGYVFSSPGLRSAWPELDRFEGSEYQRVVAWVMPAGGGRIRACVYVHRRR